MAVYRRTGDMEDETRRDRRKLAREKHLKRVTLAIPLLFFAVLLGFGVYFLITHLKSDPAPSSQETLTLDGEPVRLCFVGDVCPSAEAVAACRKNGGWDFLPCFQSVMPRLYSADLTVGNLEGVITGDEPTANAYPPALLRDLHEVGFDLLQTANSYSISSGLTGLSRTKAEIAAAGMEAVGTCDSQADYDRSRGVVVLDVGNLRVAFAAFTKGMVNNLQIPEDSAWSVNLLYKDLNYSEIDETRIEQVLDLAWSWRPDLVVALVHWGSEYNEEISDAQRQVASLLAKRGVSLVVGTHSHYVGPIERMANPASPTGSTVIAYGLGDFFSSADNENARAGCMLNVSFARSGGKVVLSGLSYVPTYSAHPDEQLKSAGWEVFDSLQTVAFYRSQHYARVSEPLCELLTSQIERMKAQTEAPDLQEP